MNENEKRFLTENARFYNADVPVKTVPKRNGNRTWAVCGIGAAVLFMMCSEPVTADDNAVGKAICTLSEYSARFEVMSITSLAERLREKNQTEVNEAPEKVNNENIIMPEDDILMLSQGSRNMPSSDDEEGVFIDDIPVPSEDADSPLPYPEQLEDNDGAITRITYQMGEGGNYINLPKGGQLRNVTSLSNEEIYEKALLAPDFKIKLNAPEDEPQVLIMHTHTTESYEPYVRDYFDKDFSTRTTDENMNMTEVGRAMARVFEKNGIRVYHDTTVHDYPSYNGSYDRSRVTVEDILSKYPSIKVVLDVHRDAIERESGERVAPSTKINGKDCAQVMLICGCDDGTMGMPECMKNLRTAALFEQAMESMYPTLTRPVLYDYRKYNQDITTGSLLIEVGGHANSIDEAVYAGELSAEAMSAALMSIAEN